MQVCYVLRHPETHFYSIERLHHVLVREIQKQAEVSTYVMPFPSSVLGAPANLMRLPRRRNTIYHIIGDVHYAALALPGKQTVVTYHDAVLLHRLSRLKRHILLEYSYRKPIQRVGAVTTVSQFAKSELERACGDSCRRVHVVHNPADPFFVRADSKASAEEPAVLQVGSGPNKNADTVIEALAGGNCDLHIVGFPHANLVQLAKRLGTSVRWHTNITDSELAGLYASATLVTFASSYEGFGLPIIEAQAIGCPVITSTCCSLPEVAGDGALFVQSGNVAELRSAVRRLLDEPALRTSLIERGRSNVARFNVQAIAAKYLAIYESLSN